ncbi:RNA-binding domain-containing protein [Marinagarivorans algicola]|uniref:RNA-binding domain-containing protein n=1 Tax=Marinagarivorans algicola TaxID=1513270 RepID=UPI003735470F
MNIKELIQQGENSAVEFKAADVWPESLAKELVAFVNGQGGVVLVGVDDSGNIKGLKTDLNRPTEFCDWVANILRTAVNPPINADVSVAQVDGKNIGVINVPKGTDKPYQTNAGQYLVRVGATNRAASVQELMRLFQQAGVFHVDANPVAGAGIKDLSLSSLDQYLTRYDLSLADDADHTALLQNMDILTAEEPTIAGLLLFGINPQRFLPNACVSYAHFAGNTIDAELIDKQVINGTLPEQIERALAVITNNVAVSSNIQGAKTEPTTMNYPQKVFRELIVNTVVHRNYSIVGSRIRILHFGDRIEFISPGRLPNTVSIQKLPFGVSYASNPIILKFLENLRYVDKLGRGLPMVWQEAKKLMRKVTFEEIGEEFKVTLSLKSGSGN